MSFNDVRKKLANSASDVPVSHACPAHGCPNAASVSFDNGRTWACFAHGRADRSEWQAITREIRASLPMSYNWNHPEKVAYESEQAAKRRAKLPAKRGPLMDLSGVSELLP